MTDTIKPIDIKNIVEAVLETKVTENIISLLQTLTQKAEKELSYTRKNKASILLKFFLEAESKTLLENLSTLQFWATQVSGVGHFCRGLTESSTDAMVAL